MARRISLAQLKSLARQVEARQRRAINDYNAAVRKATRAVDDYNRDVRRAVDTYNREVRAHNARVLENRRRLRDEIGRLERQRSTTRYTLTQTSTIELHAAYVRLDQAAEAEGWDDRELALVGLAGADAVNSARLTNTLLGEATDVVDELEDTALTDELSRLSPDLDERWQGALFALNPRNPDAARHFCTSARELIVQILDQHAPDAAVAAARPNCERRNGQVARREKVGYLLDRYGTGHAALGAFIDDDVNDVMNLFSEFNSGTHGTAGRFDLPTLRALKVRVEGAMRFLSTVIRGG